MFSVSPVSSCRIQLSMFEFLLLWLLTYDASISQYARSFNDNHKRNFFIRVLQAQFCQQLVSPRRCVRRCKLQENLPRMTTL